MVSSSIWLVTVNILPASNSRSLQILFLARDSAGGAGGQGAEASLTGFHHGAFSATVVNANAGEFASPMPLDRSVKRRTNHEYIEFYLLMTKICC
jgi:hypothetical protein